MDTMKRGLNKWLWSYMAIVMYNNMDKVCIACESSMLVERNRAYEFLVNFLLQNAPGRPAEEVLVVSGDGFFTQKRLKNGVSSTHDYYKIGTTFSCQDSRNCLAKTSTASSSWSCLK